LNCALLAKIDSYLRPLATSFLPPQISTKLYSKTRANFIHALTEERPQAYAPPKELARKLWNIEFRSPIFNAAGMFKNGEGYEPVSAQGAGAYLAGTTTSNARIGNNKNGTKLPFAPYPHSESASNWLGLPNDGDQVVAERLSKIKKVPGCPVGISLMGSPDFHGDEKLKLLTTGMNLFMDAGVDFIEINESCPNTEQGSPQDDELASRLTYIKEQVLNSRRTKRFVPVIIKFSNDTELNQVSDLLRLLISLGFDGVNFGNTSVKYDRYRDQLNSKDKKLFDYFTKTFGGGVSGKLLTSYSLALTETSAEFLAKEKPTQEFHIIRTGGISTPTDIQKSLSSGASLTQWYTGYFEQFSKHGHGVYKDLYRNL
jgi:dihydroorotate dehydrogenase